MGKRLKAEDQDWKIDLSSNIHNHKIWNSAGAPINAFQRDLESQIYTILIAFHWSYAFLKCLDFNQLSSTFKKRKKLWRGSETIFFF